MKELHCHRCKNVYYTAARQPRMPCPYCGFARNERERRDGKRMASLRNCDLWRGEVKAQVKTTDISDAGIGVRMKGHLPFDADEDVSVMMPDIGQAKRARVVWTRKFYGVSRAGLMFF